MESIKTAGELRALGPVPMKENWRRAYGWEFSISGREVRDFAVLQTGDLVRVRYLGGNGVCQLAHREALGIVPGSRDYTVEVR